MTPRPSFSVTGQRVVVVGAARSGIAAAELLVRRGATVILSDLRESIPEEAQLREAGVHLELGQHSADTFAANTDGTLTVIHQDGPDRYRVIETVQTPTSRYVLFL